MRGIQVFATRWQGPAFQILFLYLHPMKFLFTFLSFFLLYLSCLPCSDSNECSVRVQAKISANTDHQQHNHQKETCTPFCTCSCCAASTFFVSYSKAQINKVIIQRAKHPHFNVASKTEAYFSIFQPPQLMS